MISREVDIRIIKRSLILMIILILFFCIMIFLDNSKITYVSGNYSNNQSIKWSISKIDNHLISYEITGYAYLTNDDIKPFPIQILLKNLKTNKYLKINTDMRANWRYIDSSNYIYDSAGFKASVMKFKLEKDVDYEICILFSSDGHKNIVLTNRKISL